MQIAFGRVRRKTSPAEMERFRVYRLLQGLLIRKPRQQRWSVFASIVYYSVYLF